MEIDARSPELREAIECANAVAGMHTITFAIQGAGPHVISLDEVLPEITDPLTLDGASQPGNADVCTVAIPDRPSYQIVLDGQNLPGGLVLAPGSDGSVIQGLAIGGFRDPAAIALQGSDGHAIRCNFIGTNEHGTASASNWTALRLEDSADNTIGGTGPGDGNLISGNDHNLFVGHAVELIGAGTRGNVLTGNFIGTDRSGTAELRNRNGIRFDGRGPNRLGGPQPGAGNLISGNRLRGITVATGAGAAEGTVIEGNRIGTAIDGISALPNPWQGIFVESGLDITIGGLDPAGQYDCLQRQRRCRAAIDVLGDPHRRQCDLRERRVGHRSQ